MKKFNKSLSYIDNTSNFRNLMEKNYGLKTCEKIEANLFAYGLLKEHIWIDKNIIRMVYGVPRDSFPFLIRLGPIKCASINYNQLVSHHAPRK